MMEQAPPDENNLSIDRTVLANERTFQAWVRTGLSALAAGLGVARFMQESLPFWMLMGISLVLILLSALAFFLAVWRYTHLHIRMTRLEVAATPLWVVRTISYTLIACSFLAIVGLVSVAMVQG